MRDFVIERVDVWPVDVALTDDFVISQGRVSVARNVFVSVELACGAVGYGEIAPFEDLTNENQKKSEQTARKLGRGLAGFSASEYRGISELLLETAPHAVAARAGLETAVVDAYTRALGVPLWAFWGGANPHERETDITIPLVDDDRAFELANRWFGLGFRVFKMKVGVDAAQDAARVKIIAKKFPEVSFVLDANQGYSQAEAFEFLRDLKPVAERILLFEQPVPKGDVAAMAKITRDGGVRVAADESIATSEDAIRVIENKAADVINLKIMKSGLMETLRIAAVARDGGVGLMIGGMVETRLAMSFSLAIALGFEGVSYLDLDTPLLLSSDPLEGGYYYDGPKMSVWQEPGTGMRPKELPGR